MARNMQAHRQLLTAVTFEATFCLTILLTASDNSLSFSETGAPKTAWI